MDRKQIDGNELDRYITGNYGEDQYNYPPFSREDDIECEQCHYCHGDGWGIVGVDWDCGDAINGPYDGECERCPCCGGSGLEKDATFW